ncbi:MAG: DJ-1/PfpI family protein [Lentisphaerae bacterium]|nr:DJ-1/PfpI family protein [Lentisphaerota bacterium]
MGDPVMRAAIVSGLVLFNAFVVSAKEDETMPDLNGKNVLIVIASSRFRDEEFEQPYQLLKTAGAAVTVASSSKNPARGALGKTVTPDRLLSVCKAADYDAVLFVGGPGAVEYFDDPTAQALAREAVEKGKVLAAICIAPATLANAGVLKGKKATCFPSEEGTLKKGGAILVKQDVVTDGKLVTASGPQAAAEFGRAVAAKLAEK